MMRKPLSTVAMSLLAGLLLLPWSTPRSASGQERFDSTETVLVVEVPVQVLRDGEPVRGLTRDDFEIVDDRKKRDIIGFDIIDLTLTEAEGKREVADLPIAARRHFLLFFDLSFSDPNSILEARSAASELVSTGLHPTDLVAVATYSASAGIQMPLAFTSDRRQVRLAIDTLGLPQLVDTRRDPLGLVLAEQATLDVLEASGQHQSGATTAGGVDPQAEILEVLKGLEREGRDNSNRNSVLALTSSLTDLAGLMRSVEGRKYVVYLSEGFDTSTLLGTRGTSQEEQQRIQEVNEAAASGRIWEVNSNERFGSTSTQNQLTQMLQEFVRADCTVQAVDIGGLRAGGDVRPRRNSEDGLFIMADETGGDFYRNFNNLSDAMGRMLERTSVTYVLAFQPQGLEFDGKYRRLKVRLKGKAKGARLVHRPGYFAPKPLSDQTPLERQLSTANLVFEGGDGGSVSTAVLAAAFPTGGEAAYVPVLIEIDGPSLLAGNEGNVLPAEIYAYAIDSEGSVRDFFSQSMGLDLAKTGPALRNNGFKFWGNLDLPPGDYSLRILVRNSSSEATGSTIFPITVPSLDATEAALMAPLFPEPAGKWLLGREQSAQQTNHPYPFLLGETPFIPAAKPVLRANEESQLSLLGYHLGSGSLAAKVEVLSADGSAVPGPEIQLSGRSATEVPGVERLVANFRSGALPAGQYKLVVSVKDVDSGAVQSSSIPIVVEGQIAGAT